MTNQQTKAPITDIEQAVEILNCFGWRGRKDWHYTKDGSFEVWFRDQRGAYDGLRTAEDAIAIANSLMLQEKIERLTEELAQARENHRTDSSACYQRVVILEDLLTARGGKVAELQVENERLRPAMLALEHLTPGGSEYVGDVQKCIDYIRAREVDYEKHKRREQSLPATSRRLVRADDAPM